jgi:hypothetical protein
MAGERGGWDCKCSGGSTGLEHQVSQNPTLQASSERRDDHRKVLPS